MDDLLNDDLDPFDHELDYLREHVERYLVGEWSFEDPLGFIVQAEEALEQLRSGSGSAASTLARRAVLGALSTRIAGGLQVKDPADEREYLLQTVRYEAKRVLEHAPWNALVRCEEALEKARAAHRSRDLSALEDHLLDAARAAVIAAARIA